MTSQYIIGDIHNEIKNLKDNSIDLIYTNPPFGTTKAKWDKPLDWNMLFLEMDRVLKPNGTILLHCSIPFTYDLISIRKPKYHYTWKKNNPTGFFQAKIQPLRDIEEILVYYKSKPTYNPQMIGDKIYSYSRNTLHNKNTYYGERKNKKIVTAGRKGLYPRLFLGNFKRILQKDNPKSIGDEITRKMILTHSNENDMILDMTCCSKNNGIISNELNRNYIGIDISDEFMK